MFILFVFSIDNIYKYSTSFVFCQLYDDILIRGDTTDREQSLEPGKLVQPGSAGRADGGIPSSKVTRQHPRGDVTRPSPRTHRQ